MRQICLYYIDKNAQCQDEIENLFLEFLKYILVLLFKKRYVIIFSNFGKIIVVVGCCF